VLASNASTLFREFTATPLSKTAPPKLMIAPSLTAEAFQSTVTVPTAMEADDGRGPAQQQGGSGQGAHRWWVMRARLHL
jgi:hypothetical protein